MVLKKSCVEITVKNLTVPQIAELVDAMSSEYYFSLSSSPCVSPSCFVVLLTFFFLSLFCLSLSIFLFITAVFCFVCVTEPEERNADEEEKADEIKTEQRGP